MIKKGIALLLIIGAVYWSFFALQPNTITHIDTDIKSFSTERALIHLKEISKEEHYLGSTAHDNVREYIVEQLQNLGLETHIQEAYSLSKWGNLSKPKNILARLKGSEKGKALLLLTHYDSNPHSSFGASDAGSGVVTILESLRAYLASGKIPKNDIIILISDGEELGLNGADIFVNQHKWAKEVGLVLNFEARGSGGPSYMLVETNGGNASLIKAFVDANPNYPVATSLAYSIYKMLPNDTDLTRFREDGDIDGFNFAFIDDHFDYHSALDTYERLDRTSLEHQGDYLMTLLNHFSESNLSNLKSDNDYIFFNVPIFKTIVYPFSWILPMLILAILAFIALIFYGFSKRVFELNDVLKGLLAFVLFLIVSVVIGVFGWSLLKVLYPGYSEILHGFTYNGHDYIVAFSCLTLAVGFCIYNRVYKPENTAALLLAPLLFWLIVCSVVAFKLKGASFFIVPVFFGLISLFMLFKQKKPNIVSLTLLSVPVIFIMTPFVKMFPVGLGLKMLVATTVLITLVFGLLIATFGFFQHKKRLSYIFLVIGLIFFGKAHLKSEFSSDNPKPNSLVYLLNSNSNSAVWATYDDLLDSWTKKHLGDSPNAANEISKNTLGSKYKTGFTFTKETSAKNIPFPEIEIVTDTILNNKRHVNLLFTSQRDVNRIEVFADSIVRFNAFKINSIEAKRIEDKYEVFTKRFNNRLFSYYVADNEPLNMEFIVPENQKTALTFYEASYDLLKHKDFSVKQRDSTMIPKPFVLNDAIIVERTITLN